MKEIFVNLSFETKGVDDYKLFTCYDRLSILKDYCVIF